MSYRILLLKPQLVNIGNGMIAKGAKALLERAFPESEIIESSAYPYFMSDIAVENGGDEGLLNNTVGVGDYVDIDAAILPGCVLYPHPLRRHLPLFQRLNESSTPIFVVGAGGNDYEPDTQRAVSDLLEDAGISGLITRDEPAYEAYSDVVPEAYSGMDCAFFIDEWYEPPEADRDFVTATFDKVEEPDFNDESRIVRPHHAPFDLLRDVYEGDGVVGSVLNAGRKFTSDNELETAYDELRKNNLFVSDNIRDYVFFYANASEVHADRIHACVPGLMYGNKIKFYYETPRARLFDGMVDETDDGFEVIDEQILQEKKEKQTAWLSSLFEKYVE